MGSIRATMLAVVAIAVCGLAETGRAATGLPPGLTDSLFVAGLSAPTAMQFAPDGRLFVTQQTGQLRVIKNGVLLPTPFLTLTVNASGERGLLGVAFDPNFLVNQFVYVFYTATTPAVHNRVSRFRANGDVVDTSEPELVLLDFENLSATNHNGGAMHFGLDGKLYVAHGDNANGANAQAMTNLLGKIIRMNPVPESGNQIPTDNPFYSSAPGRNRLIWVLGLRNPFTFSIQPATGLTYVNDVGQGAWEEIDDARPGRNFGWPSTEGAFNPGMFPQFTNPVYSYAHSGPAPTGCAITGGAFYNPPVSTFPQPYVGNISSQSSARAGFIDPDPANPGDGDPFAENISSPVDLEGRAGCIAVLPGARNGQHREDLRRSQPAPTNFRIVQ